MKDFLMKKSGSIADFFVFFSTIERQQIKNKDSINLSGVSFTLRDVTKEKIEKKYDFAYSRDAIMYMTFEGKEKMFTNVFEALRPGAKAVFIDFCGPSGDETQFLCSI